MHKAETTLDGYGHLMPELHQAEAQNGVAPASWTVHGFRVTPRLGTAVHSGSATRSRGLNAAGTGCTSPRWKSKTAIRATAADYQFIEELSAGLTRLSIAVSPRLGPVDESALIRATLGYHAVREIG